MDVKVPVVPEFVGFGTLDPGVYSAVIDVDGISQDETGTWRLPYIYNPGGDPTVPPFVVVGFPS